MPPTLHDFTATLSDGTAKPLSDYRGKILLVVNTASQCGFTPQYKGLQALYEKYRDRGLEILAFPSDQFGHQEPGPDSEIATFCEVNFGVTFPLFKKIDVNGDTAHPLYKWLKAAAPGLLTQGIKWNFTKFLIDREGRVIDRFAPTTTPEKLEKDVVDALENVGQSAAAE
jgi:glutathione peroxidase